MGQDNVDTVWQSIVAAEVTTEVVRAKEQSRDSFLDLLLEISDLPRPDNDSGPCKLAA